MALLSFNGMLALGTGQSSFVEMVGSGYARQSITMASSVDNSPVIANINMITFTPGASWPNATQLGLFSLSGQLIMWWNWYKTQLFPVTNIRTIQVGRISLTVPSPGVVGSVTQEPNAFSSELSGAAIAGGVSALAFFLLLGSQSFSVFDLSSLPTSYPGNNSPWLNGGVLQVGP